MNTSIIQLIIQQIGYILFTISLVLFYGSLVYLIFKNKIFKK
jgi:hypothetical protein